MANTVLNEEIQNFSELRSVLNSYHKIIGLNKLVEILKSIRKPSDFLQDYVKFSEKNYTRTSLLKNDHYELLLLCWRKGQRSPLHDHEGSNCAMLVVDGEMREEKYVINDLSLELSHSESFRRGSVTGLKDKDIHQVINDSAGDLITLHLYSPPLNKMNQFDPKTQKI